MTSLPCFTRGVFDEKDQPTVNVPAAGISRVEKCALGDCELRYFLVRFTGQKLARLDHPAAARIWNAALRNGLRKM